jgi:Ca2+-binding RTX toxin-like protein
MAWMIGTPFNDTILPGSSSYIAGGHLLPGSGGTGDGDDTIVGTPGLDVIDGGGGLNTLDYGPGVFGSFPIVVNFGSTAYAGTVNKGGGIDQFTRISTLIGTSFIDVLMGSSDTTPGLPFTIVLRGGLGDDLIYGLSNPLNRADYGDAQGGVAIDLGLGRATGAFTGADMLFNVVHVGGSAHADTIIGSDGSRGAEMLAGGLGDDRYTIQARTAVVVEAAGGGRDEALVAVDGWVANAGLETLRLGGGATELTGSGGGEAIFGQALLGSRIDGAGGDDVLWGGFEADTLSGGDGQDILLGVAGADLLGGGAGDDLYVIADGAAAVSEQAGGGRDSVWVHADLSWTMPAEVEIAYLGGAAWRFAGGAGGDIILGNGALANTIDGGAGHDQIYGGALRDVLRGGEGNDGLNGLGGGDTLEGGDGDDLYVIGDSGDVAVEEAGQGFDVALVTVGGWTVSPGVEQAILGEAADTLLAGEGNQFLLGNATRGSTLSGGGGNDTLYGTAFADVLAGGAGDDILSSGGGAGRLLFNVAVAGGGFGHDSVFGLSLGATFDFRGSGLAGIADLTFTDLGGAIRVTSAAGTIDFYAAPLSAIQGMDMLF